MYESTSAECPDVNRLAVRMWSAYANVALQRMGYRNKQTLHGFRGIYRSLVDTYQNEHNISYEVKKRFLDHPTLLW